MSTAIKDWKWFGNAGHFICGQWCRFHICTQVGNYLVSTVGEYVHPANSGASEVTERLWLAKNPLGERIGAGKDDFFETLVFRAGNPCECGCGIPSIAAGGETGGRRYANRKDATEGHMELCKRFARRKS